MLNKLENVIQDLSSKMRQLKTAQLGINSSKITERDEMIVSLLAKNGPMTVSNIANADSQASFSTISMNVTKLWRNKLVLKTISPKNQRITMVELTEQGKKLARSLEVQRADRAKILLQALKLNDNETQLLINVLTRAIPLIDNPLVNKELDRIQTDNKY